jgi:hypothetical protein
MLKRLGIYSAKSLVAAAAIGGLLIAAPTASFAAGGFSTKAKVALVQAPSGTLRSKGVASVTHPGTGVYCVAPSKKLNFGAIYPVVTVEWGYSSGDGLLAFWFLDGNDCPANTIEVLTYNFSFGPLVRSDSVAFSLLVE